MCSTLDTSVVNLLLNIGSANRSQIVLIAFEIQHSDSPTGLERDQVKQIKNIHEMFLSLVFVNLVKSVAAAGSQGPRFLV